MTGYSLGVNGENQTKLKEKSWVRCSEEVVHCDKEVCHGKAIARRGEEEVE